MRTHFEELAGSWESAGILDAPGAWSRPFRAVNQALLVAMMCRDSWPKGGKLMS